MAVTFTTFTFTNKASGIDVDVTLEAPTGTPVVSAARVTAGKSQHFPVNKPDVDKVKIAVMDVSGVHNDTKSLDFTSSRSFIETLAADWFPGSITGSATTRY